MVRMNQTIFKILGSVGFLMLLLGCRPALWQQGAQPTLTLPEGATYFREDAHSLPLQSVTAHSLSDAWLILRLPSGQYFGLPWQELRPNADGKSLAAPALFLDTLRWVSFGGGTLRHRPVDPGLRKRRKIQWNGIPYIDVALHPTISKKWEQVKPARLWIGTSRWVTRSIKGKVDLRLTTMENEGGAMVRCEARNTSGQSWTLFQPNGAFRFHLYARGWGKPGNHALFFLPEFQKSMQPIQLPLGEWTTVFDFPVAGFTQPPPHMEWRYGKRISLPGVVPSPGKVPSVEVWFSVVMDGKPFVSDLLTLGL
jgi:hypothetical protein